MRPHHSVGIAFDRTPIGYRHDTMAEGVDRREMMANNLRGSIGTIGASVPGSGQQPHGIVLASVT